MALKPKRLDFRCPKYIEEKRTFFFLISEANENLIYRESKSKMINCKDRTKFSIFKGNFQSINEFNFFIRSKLTYKAINSYNKKFS